MSSSKPFRTVRKYHQQENDIEITENSNGGIESVRVTTHMLGPGRSHVFEGQNAKELCISQIDNRIGELIDRIGSLRDLANMIRDI